MSIKNNKYQERGDAGEALFQQEVEKRFGVTAQPTPHTHPYDFNIDDTRVEVKYSTYGPNGYQANLRGHDAKDFDILVLILWAGISLSYLIIPADKVTQTKITIRNKEGRGKFSAYKNNWNLLAQAIGA